jgi:ATP-dependent RNA helicase RhlE
MSFDSLGLNAALLRGIEDLDFTVPTPIQRDSIPVALMDRDLLACSMTGSGKTAAFLLPILHRLMEKKRGVTRALVLTPTRELAAQIEAHLRLIARHTPITSATVFGGVPMAPQERAIRRGVDVLIATPGRLLDHFRYPHGRLDGLEHLVLDEADRMLDMGFLPDIRRILKHLPSQRQTFFFSATLPPPIVTLAGEMLRQPVPLNVERAVAPPSGLSHTAYTVAQTKKSGLLEHLLREDEMKSVVVFTRTKHRANRLTAFLEARGISCARIHGNRSQSQRTLALSGFRDRKFRVLVATDIAARGIDVEALSHVVNFDVPHVPEDYIHRAGRTARAEATGDAVTFVAPEEEADFRAIEKTLGNRIPRIALPEFITAEAPELPVPASRSQRSATRQPSKAPRSGGPGAKPPKAERTSPNPRTERDFRDRSAGEPVKSATNKRGRNEGAKDRELVSSRDRRSASNSPATATKLPAAYDACFQTSPVRSGQRRPGAPSRRRQVS